MCAPGWGGGGPPHAQVTCRMKRADVIDNANIQAGDVVVGLASAGQATYETEYQASERERWSERERERERETATYEAEYQASVCVREERVWAGVAYKTEYQASVWGRERGRETFIYEGSDCGCDGGGWSHTRPSGRRGGTQNPRRTQTERPSRRCGPGSKAAAAAAAVLYL